MNRLTQVSGSVLLDTSIAIALMRNDAVVSAAIANASELFTTDIVLGELYYGAYRSSDLERNLQQVQRFASLCRVLSTNREVAEQYGVLKRTLAKAGTPIPENDIWIAATALFYGLPLATRDQHFEHVSGLTIVNW